MLTLMTKYLLLVLEKDNLSLRFIIIMNAGNILYLHSSEMQFLSFHSFYLNIQFQVSFYSTAVDKFDIIATVI